MPLLIDSAPDCIIHKEHFSADDAADFVLNNNFKDCAGFGTFMPGSTYGEDGSSAQTLYMIVTWLGIVVMVAVLVAWVVYENRRLIRGGRGIHAGGAPSYRTAAAARRSGRRSMIDNGSSKRQIEFLPLQTHKKSFETRCLRSRSFVPSWSW